MDGKIPCPHLLLLDMHLLKRDGNEILRHLRAIERRGQTPVGILTSSEAPRSKRMREAVDPGITPASVCSGDQSRAACSTTAVVFNLVLQLAGEGDPTDDPNAPWPDDRPRVSIGRLEITRTTTVEEIGEGNVVLNVETP